jgi:hypothetical protein
MLVVSATMADDLDRPKLAFSRWPRHGWPSPGGPHPAATRSCSLSLLTALFEALRFDQRIALGARFASAAEAGWVGLSQVGALVEELGLFGCRDELLALAQIEPQVTFYRPYGRADSAQGSNGISIAQLADFLIFLERLGLDVVPAPLVERLLPAISRQKLLTQSELNVFWYRSRRHKEPIELTAHTAAPVVRSPLTTFTTAAGYFVFARLDTNGQVRLLSVEGRRESSN